MLMAGLADSIGNDGVARQSGSAGAAGTTRREALQMMGVAAAVACAGARPLGELQAAAAKTGEADDDALDEAYGLLHRQEPQCKMGLSTHAPMVAEALCALGHGERAVQWVNDYRGPVRQLPTPSSRIDGKRWRAALGPQPGAATWEASNARWGDWREFFIAELSENRWQDVLDLWVGRLAPGMSGAATHGVIRTAHAVRALVRHDTPTRRGELARGLAYWASSYEELPARERTAPRVDTFAQALAEVPLYWEAFGRTPEGHNIVEALRHVRELDSFAEVRDLIAAPVDLDAGISALTATFCRVYLRHGTKHDAIAFVHAVTGPCSLRRIAPHIKPETARAVFPYAWQTAAAIYSAYGRKGDAREEKQCNLAPGELSASAIKNGDAHAIKFTEVMLAEHKINPDPAYLAAAEDACRRL
jgi:hypothetical protein